jgi:D-alanyl-D-alanine carboxypeptidase/D-alanyl-D-alanine-endopeptidase (penicillin-binding protein 4)
VTFVRSLIALALLLTLAATSTAAAAPGAPPLSQTREPVPPAPATTASSPTARASAISGNRLAATLRGPMSQAGSGSGGAVFDVTNNRSLFVSRGDVRRAPASVEKLYTLSTALLKYGPDETLRTRVVGDGELGDDGTYTGNLYVVGAGDPTFGSRSFTLGKYGTGATTFQLAQKLAAAGVEKVQGKVFGDASYFDRFPGVPDSGLNRASGYVGALSGLTYDRGAAPLFAAQQFKVALKDRDITVSGKAGTGRAPSGADELAAADSPTIRTLARMTLRPSDNFFAEMIIKGLGAAFGGAGSTAAGAKVVRSTLADFGVAPRVVDGSGLSRSNQTSPNEVVKLLAALPARAPVYDAVFDGMPVAGRNGTLYGRMRGTAAQDRCHAKTGTLSNVSALAGYCKTQGGELVAFAFLMNRVSVGGAHDLQDRMTAAVARYDAQT